MRWRNWKLFTVMILLAAMLYAATYARKGKEKGRQPSPAQAAETDEAEREVTEAEVPAAALATLKRLAASARITEFAEEMEHGHTFYEGSWKVPSRKMDVLVTPTGDLVEIEEQVGINQVPVAVLKAARKAAGNGTQLVFEKKTMILYEVKFQKANLRHELLLTPDGRRVEEGVEKCKPDDDEGEDDEQVSINDVPKRVKATILRHAKGGKVGEIERENEDGKVIFEAEVLIDGKEYELKIAANGKLLSKEAEDEDNDEDDDDDDEDEDDDDEDEEEVSINDVPKRVKATILRHAKGGKVGEIERENEDGKVIFEAEVLIDGKEYELKIATNGKLLSKEAEDENDDDEDEDDDEDDDDD